MAWRLNQTVVRGEIDNRTKGTVTGKIRLFGVEKPIELNQKVLAEGRVPAERLTRFHDDFCAVREEILQLMDKYRSNL